jgi:hypothetical protein
MSGQGSGIKSDDISHLALLITLPTVTASTLSSFIIGNLRADSIAHDFLTVLDFTLTSFPLTLSVAILVGMALDNELKFWTSFVVIIVAGLLANLLGMLIHKVHHTDDLGVLFEQSTKEVKGLPVLALFAFKIVSVWWRDFGPIMFIQSVIVGAVIAYRLTKKREPLILAKNALKEHSPLQKKNSPPITIKPGPPPFEKIEPPPFQPPIK